MRTTGGDPTQMFWRKELDQNNNDNNNNNNDNDNGNDNGNDDDDDDANNNCMLLISQPFGFLRCTMKNKCTYSQYIYIPL